MNTTKLNYKQEQAMELVKKLKSFGYIVYLAEKGTHGFFHRPNEDKHINFQLDFYFSFSSNHISKNIGSGHQLIDGFSNIENATKDFFEQMLNCPPYKSRRKNEVFIRWKTVKEHLDFYNSSSKYTII